MGKNKKNRKKNHATCTYMTTQTTPVENKTTSVATTSVTQTTNTSTTTSVTNTTSTANTTSTKTIYRTQSKNYNYMGTKNFTEFPQFVNLCTVSQKVLKILLELRLKSAGYTEIISGDGYLYAKGNVPILLTAHMDTVHKELVQDYYEYYDKEKDQHIISSPQGIGGDDRCGVYMILELIKTHKCSVLFCEDEEIGCVGSGKFCKSTFIDDLKDMKYLIELDRRSDNDAVFYDCENDDFTKFIEDNTGYTEAYGSCSDISHLAPAAKVAAVNFSCGYYNAHTTSEYVIIEEMLNTIEVVRKLLDVECEQFEYIEKPLLSHNWKSGGYYGGYYDRYYDDYYYGRYYDGYYGGYGASSNSKNTSKTQTSKLAGIEDDDTTEGYWENYYKNKAKQDNAKSIPFDDDDEDEMRSLLIYVYNTDEEEMYTYVSNGRSSDEAFGKFFLENEDYCYADIYDYEYYEYKVLEDGWYTGL